MKDLKIRPGMDTPKAKLKNPTPKDAESILKKHMDQRQKEKEPESHDPVRYATDRVEKNMRRGAQLSDGHMVRNVVLFSVLVYELVGPTLTRMALTAAGEIRPEGRTNARVENKPEKPVSLS